MFTFRQLFLGLLLPAIVSGGILGITKSLVSKTAQENAETGNRLSSGWRIAGALSAGYIVGYFGLEGFSALPFPPREGIHWLCCLAIIGFIVGCFWHFTLSGRLIVQAGLSVVIPRLLLNSTFKHTWGQLEGVIWWICLAAAVFVFWSLVQQSFTTLISDVSVPFVYLGISGGTALILALSGSLRLAQHCSVLVVLFATIWGIALIGQRNGKHQIFLAGASPVVTLLLAGIWMNGYFFAYVPAASAVLLAVSLLLARVGRIEAVQKLGTSRSVLVQVAAIALPVVAAIIIAVARSGIFGDDSGYKNVNNLLQKFV